MLIDTDKIVTMTAANQNFSAVARQTDRDGKTVIFKNNRPKYVLLDLDAGNYLDLTDAERIGIVLAVENAFEPPNSAREVLGLISPYLGNPAVGVCFDTGHANCMLMKPGKELAKYRDYMHKSWYETGIVAVNDGLELLKPHIVTTHMHDNDGYGDLHSMPGDGDTDWPAVLAELRSAPRMLEFQTEVCYQDGTNWAGELLAPVGGYSIKRIVETFRGLGF